jgi:hypothetical protein
MILDNELKEMFHVHGDIPFYQTFEWLLPSFGGESFYECLLAWMCNFMLHNIKANRLMSKYYHPANGKGINKDNAVHFFGCQLARSLRGNLSIDGTWLTQELLDVIGTCMECMPNNAFKEIYQWLHIDDNWDNNG